MSERNDRFEAMLPCPFCGGDAIRGVSGGGVFMVSCGNKECKADVSVPQSIWGEDGQPQDVSWEEMISAWNQRAATALAEAQATIARQQVLLDRALEASFNDRARAERAEAALRKIEAWELPPSGFFYPNADGTDSDRPAPYDSFYGFGSQGGKSAIRAIARAALERSEG